MNVYSFFNRGIVDYKNYKLNS